jgi:arylsulfatase A-like enzyme
MRGPEPPRSASHPSPSPSTTQAVGAARPNILVIVTDDQRYDEMVGMGRTLGWLGRHGERFTHAMVTTPLCCPSRASIFTGDYAHNTGVHTNGHHAYRSVDQSATIQAILQRAGYATGIVGKYFNDWPVGRRPPHFGRWSIFTPATPASTGYRGTVWNVDGRIERPSAYSTDFVSGRAVSFLHSFAHEPGRPWFLYVAPFAPHGPALAGPGCTSFAVPKLVPSPAMLETDRSDKPPWVRSEPHAFARSSRFWEPQIRALCSVDRMVGTLRETLRRLHELRNTLVIYMSDNGVFLGEHGLGDKGFPYFADLRVPLLMSWPGHVPAGVIDGRSAANIDVAPTVLDAAGLSPSPPRPMDGRSLLRRWQRNTFLAEWWKGSNRDFPAPTWAALITRRYEYVEYVVGTKIVYREYYDLVHDPWELVNLLSQPRPRHDLNINRLHRVLRRLRSCTGNACR